MRRLLLMAMLLLGIAASARAQEPANYIPVWVEKDGLLTTEALQATLSAVAAQDADPKHIVVLIHGFDVPREDSTRQFETVGQLLHDEFARQKRKVVVIGLQWDSDVDVGLAALAGAYMDTVTVARSVGHQAARQLFLGLHERWPEARINTCGHSMGCEVTAAAIAPEMKYKEGSQGEGTVAAPLLPEKDVHLNLVTLAGSDLDYDVFAQSGIQARTQKPRLRMLWMTLSPVLGDKDEVLKLRKVLRGQAAGNSFPLMTETQYDAIFSHKAAFFDNEDIPKSHDFLLYYDQPRVAQLAAAMLWLAEPKAVPEPAGFREMDQVMLAPADADALARFLDTPHLNTQIYALWRLEKVLCGGSKHLADGFLPSVAALLRHTPRQVLSLRKSDETTCQTVKKAYWPTTKQMTRAGVPPWAAP